MVDLARLYWTSQTFSGDFGVYKGEYGKHELVKLFDDEGSMRKNEKAARAYAEKMNHLMMDKRA